MEFFKIKMFGVFASDIEASFFGDEGLVTFKQIQNSLKDAGGQDIEVDLSSVGGRVDVGTDIFFAFRDYKRQYPQAQMILNIKSQAASMASFLSEGEFWDIVTVEDISSFMMHNPANIVQGDYRLMKENAVYLERLAVLYSGAYQKRSKKSEKEIRNMMDKTTWLYGQEIVDAGFADEVLATTELPDDEKNKDAMIAQTVLKYDSMMEKLQQVKMKREDFQKAVASVQNIEPGMQSNYHTGTTTGMRTSGFMQTTTIEKPAASGNNNNQEDVTMKDIIELKEKFPDIHAATMQAGEEKERARVKSLAEMKKRKEFDGIVAISERIDEGILNGEDVNTVQVGIMALLSKNSMQASIESPGDINTGSADTMSGETQVDTSTESKW